ncbi:hypothetical protein IWX63_000300 [Arthrobacter sp. CAN_A2]|uniref:DUF7144 family membrane protein n=1 Tax=Arthrobacter sp. CAN_A2 TaxID=2787718 RepID=UPI0018EF50B7
MSNDSRTSTTNFDRSSSQPSVGAIGVTVLAGTLMIMIGVFHAFQGIVALLNDTFYVVLPEYVLAFDITTWGWVHLILGLVVAFAGAALFRGAVWARTVAVIVACISMAVSFVWMPYYPLWSLTVIALDVFVIWAAVLHGRDIVAE